MIEMMPLWFGHHIKLVLKLRFKCFHHQYSIAACMLDMYCLGSVSDGSSYSSSRRHSVCIICTHTQM